MTSCIGGHERGPVNRWCDVCGVLVLAGDVGWDGALHRLVVPTGAGARKVWCPECDDMVVLFRPLTGTRGRPGRPRADRLPFPPLVRAAQAISGLPPGRHDGFTAARLALMIGYTRRTVHRWANNGVPWTAADDVAIRLGRHPCELWPEWWVDGRAGLRSGAVYRLERR